MYNTNRCWPCTECVEDIKWAAAETYNKVSVCRQYKKQSIPPTLALPYLEYDSAGFYYTIIQTSKSMWNRDQLTR